ncbi:MAG: cell division protein FtsQ/DivIB [Muribaculaceae bacterium]|nr:cell division protein FtsQ/DivIB [Muribaculaceae bacterium]
MSKRNLIILFLCIILGLYLIVAIGWSRFSARTQKIPGLENGMVKVIDPEGTGFVTPEEITDELFASLPDSLRKLTYEELDLSKLRLRLRNLDKIESAEVVRLSNDSLRVRVTPLKPVARIWTDSESYYVNREGKRIAASSKYRIDVPQITGHFDSLRPATSLLPLLDALAARKDFEQMITMINAKDSANIILIPAIRGHVINLGSISDLDSKFARLQTFYRRVLPVKGWEHYDTISLKWDGQIVASRRHNKLPDLTIKLIEELEQELDSPETMEAPAPKDDKENPENNNSQNNNQ